MSTVTPNLSLTKPDPQELYDIEVHNTNSDRIDAFFGVHFCTSGTRPASPAIKQQIFETDTQQGFAWNGTEWDQISSLAQPDANPAPTIVALSDGATVALDSSQGRLFRLFATGDRTLSSPTNAADGRAIIIAHSAIGGARTLTLETGTAGAFKYGVDITGLTATIVDTTDYIGCIYNEIDARWHVISYVKGL